MVLCRSDISINSTTSILYENRTLCASLIKYKFICDFFSSVVRFDVVGGVLCLVWVFEPHVSRRLKVYASVKVCRMNFSTSYYEYWM